jgi:hypothetical protein
MHITMKRLLLVLICCALTGCDDSLSITSKTYGQFHEWSKSHVSDPAELEMTRILTTQGQEITRRIEADARLYAQKQEPKEIADVDMLADLLQRHLDIFLSDPVIRNSPNLPAYEQFHGALSADVHDLNALIPRIGQPSVLSLMPKAHGLKRDFSARLKGLPK